MIDKFIKAIKSLFNQRSIREQIQKDAEEAIHEYTISRLG
jgi:hypothetical protein